MHLPEAHNRGWHRLQCMGADDQIKALTSRVFLERHDRFGRAQIGQASARLRPHAWVGFNKTQQRVRSLTQNSGAEVSGPAARIKNLGCVLQICSFQKNLQLVDQSLMGGIVLQQ